MRRSKGRWLRSRLTRDIAIILTIKLIALVTIKVVWFSDPPTPAAPDVARMLLSPTVQVRQ